MLYVVKIRLNADFCFKMKNFELLKLKTLSKRWRKILFAEFLMSLSEFLREKNLIIQYFSRKK